MTKRKRVLILAKSLDGGTGTFVKDIQAIAAPGRITVSNLILEKPLYRRLENIKIKFFSQNKKYPEKYGLGFGTLINFIQEILWLKKYIVAFSPETIISVDIHANLLSIICKTTWFQWLKVIATSHIDLNATINSKSSPPASKILKILVGYFYEKADILVGVSKQVSKHLKKDFNLTKNVITIYNGVKIEKLIKPRNLSNSVIKIVSIGRLYDQKDFETLILSFKSLLNKLPKSELQIIGDGPNKEKLESLTEQLGLKGKIILTGWVQYPMATLKKSDLFVLSSKREGLPYVLIEAMSVGVPIISTNCDYGPREILNNGKYGLLVPVGKPDKMRDAMLNILTHKKVYKKYSMRSIRRSRQFDLRQTISSYTSLIS